MTSQDKLFFYIVRGPSKFDLMLSLFDGNQLPRRTVEFALKGSPRFIPVAITSVEQEDGSGESWNFQGWVAIRANNYRIAGYFSTASRSGHLRIEVPFHYVMKDGVEQKVVEPGNQLAVEHFVESLRR